MLSFREPLQLGVARILLIEREASHAMVLASILRDCFAVPPELDIAPSGRAGADMLRREQCDLIIADVASLCDLGVETEEAVGRLAKLAGEALTVVLSEETSVTATVAAMRAGAHDCLRKPIDTPVLTARIAALAMRHGRMLGLRHTPAQESPITPVLVASLVGGVESEPGRGAHRPTVLPMWQQEQRIIEDAIASFSGNIALAAAALQLSPSTIYRKRQAWADAGGAKGAAA